MSTAIACAVGLAIVGVSWMWWVVRHVAEVAAQERVELHGCGDRGR